MPDQTAFIFLGLFLSGLLAAVPMLAVGAGRRGDWSPFSQSCTAWSGIVAGYLCAAVLLESMFPRYWLAWPTALMLILPIGWLANATTFTTGRRHLFFWLIVCVGAAAVLGVGYRWQVKEPSVLWYCGMLALALCFVFGSELATAGRFWTSWAYWLLVLCLGSAVIVGGFEWTNGGQAWGMLAAPLCGAGVAGALLGARFLAHGAHAPLSLAIGLLLAFRVASRVEMDVELWRAAVLIALAPWPLAATQLRFFARWNPRWVLLGALLLSALLLAWAVLPFIDDLRELVSGSDDGYYG